MNALSRVADISKLPVYKEVFNSQDKYTSQPASETALFIVPTFDHYLLSAAIPMDPHKQVFHPAVITDTMQPDTTSKLHTQFFNINYTVKTS